MRWQLAGKEDILFPFVDDYEGDALPLLLGLQRILDDPYAEGDEVPGFDRRLARVYFFGDFVVRATVVEQFHVINLVQITSLPTGS